MAQASTTVVIPVSQSHMWSVITDYEKYNQFVSSTKDVKILSETPGQRQIKYNIELLGKDIFYTLKHIEEAPSKMSWSLVEGNIMKVSNGGWNLKPISPEETEVTYSLELEFKIYVPGFVLNNLVKSTLPSMLKEFEKRALELKR